MAVADVFDALTSRKPYQDRMELDKVMEIIEKETGTAFEPYVVYNFKFIPLEPPDPHPRIWSHRGN